MSQISSTKSCSVSQGVRPWPWSIWTASLSLGTYLINLWNSSRVMNTFCARLVCWCFDDGSGDEHVFRVSPVRSNAPSLGFRNKAWQAVCLPQNVYEDDTSDTSSVHRRVKKFKEGEIGTQWETINLKNRMFSKRIRELGSVAVHTRRLWWRLCWIVFPSINTQKCPIRHLLSCTATSSKLGLRLLPSK